jgi:hypothetical protein
VNTDQLISALVADVKPVRRLLDPMQRAALWVAAALVCVSLGLLHFGVRRDIDSAWHDVTFILRLALLVSTMWLSVIAAFRLAVPGRDTRAWSRWWPIIGLAALVALAAGEVITGLLYGDAGSPLRAWMCVRKVAFVGTVPAILAVALIQRAEAVEPKWTALLGVLAAGAAGALTSELACPIKAPIHIMLWHVLPVALSAGLGAVIGSILLAWARGKRRRRF